ncbi:MAG: hypothetical protein V4696_07745 [Pseudomonadota bacterium]
MDNADREFCLRRADEERERAESSDDPGAAWLHEKLAQLYELRASDPAAWAKLSTQ